MSRRVYEPGKLYQLSEEGQTRYLHLLEKSEQEEPEWWDTCEGFDFCVLDSIESCGKIGARLIEFPEDVKALKGLLRSGLIYPVEEFDPFFDYDKLLYHGTQSEKVEEIEKAGLKGPVYLASTPGAAGFFSHIFGKGKRVIYEVEPKSGRRIRRDPYYAGFGYEFADAGIVGRIFLCEEDIPPGEVREIKEGDK